MMIVAKIGQKIHNIGYKASEGSTTLSIMAFSIKILSLKGLFATFSIMTLSITTLCHYA